MLMNPTEAFGICAPIHHPHFSSRKTILSPTSAMNVVNILLIIVNIWFLYAWLMMVTNNIRSGNFTVCYGKSTIFNG